VASQLKPVAGLIFDVDATAGVFDAIADSAAVPNVPLAGAA
jgi:hypothetical protein